MEISVPGCLIRPIVPSETELAQVLAVYRQCQDFLALGPVAIASPEMVAADLELSRRDGGIFHVIEDTQSGQLVGVVDFVLAGFDGNLELAYLALLMIAAPHRNRGLGAAVVQAVEDAIRGDGRARAIQSGVQVNNPAAIRFWQHMGYTIVSGAESMSDGTVTFKLWKSLSA